MSKVVASMNIVWRVGGCAGPPTPASEAPADVVKAEKKKREPKTPKAPKVPKGSAKAEATPEVIREVSGEEAPPATESGEQGGEETVSDGSPGDN
jgi:hypothetical protein